LSIVLSEKFVTNMKRSVAVIALLLLVAACGTGGPTKDVTKDWAVQKLYGEAKTELENGNYKRAINYYEKLESRFPYGAFAQQSQLEVAYAYFRERETASAIAACDRFIKLYPNHPNVDYAYYLKGLVTFNEDLGLLAKFSNQDMTERDPKAMQESFASLQELVNRFPNSKYTPDAINRMQYLVNAMASYEVNVADYYLRRRAYVAAVNRAQTAITTFPQAPALERAFLVQMTAYESMGMKELAADSERLLTLNFPNSKLLAAKKRKSWWNNMWSSN
jgi:outer membrane protein assembly factor BamD